MGGRAAHQKGTAHEWTPAEAKLAGWKGGKARARRRIRLAVDNTQPRTAVRERTVEKYRAGSDDPINRVDDVLDTPAAAADEEALEELIEAVEEEEAEEEAELEAGGDDSDDDDVL